MIITAIADLHGDQPELPGGDLLIIAGDLVAKSRPFDYFRFHEWLSDLPYRKIVFIGGNHDVRMINVFDGYKFPDHISYLFDSFTIFDGIKIYGTSWLPYAYIYNEHCNAFTKFTNDELMERYNLIPEDTDILVTHVPPYDMLDTNKQGVHCGSTMLRHVVLAIKPSLHFFGHIHEWGGKYRDLEGTRFFNASILDEDYLPLTDIRAHTFEFTRGENEE